MIVVRPAPSSPLMPKTNENTIVANTVLYGATGGKLFAAGQAGERFAVRNSGAITVVEGCGSNGCEYMTGGRVVILGSVGDNRSEEHTSELQSLMRISYAVFCLKKKKNISTRHIIDNTTNNKHEETDIIMNNK